MAGVPLLLERLGVTPQNDRRIYGADHQPGVVGAGDLKATAAGGFTLSFAAGIGALRGTDPQQTNQGVYPFIFNAAETLILPAPPAAGGNPRMDKVFARIRDGSIIGTSQDDVIFDYVQGTSVAGTVLDNGNTNGSAGAAPASSLLIADVLRTPGEASISAGNIRDRRSWARGYMEFDVAAPGVRDFVIEGLDGDADVTYKIEVEGIVTGAGAVTHLVLQANGVAGTTSVGPYDGIFFYSDIEAGVSGSTAPAVFENADGILLTQAKGSSDYDVLAEAQIAGRVGKKRLYNSKAVERERSGTGNSMRMSNGSGFWNDTTAILRSLTLHAVSAGGKFQGKIRVQRMFGR